MVIRQSDVELRVCGRVERDDSVVLVTFPCVLFGGEVEVGVGVYG